MAKYAERIGDSADTVKDRIYAFEVFTESRDVPRLSRYYSQLTEIHSAPPEHWPKLAAALVKDGWSVEVPEHHRPAKVGGVFRLFLGGAWIFSMAMLLTSEVPNGATVVRRWPLRRG